MAIPRYLRGSYTVHVCNMAGGKERQTTRQFRRRRERREDEEKKLCQYFRRCRRDRSGAAKVHYVAESRYIRRHPHERKKHIVPLQRSFKINFTATSTYNIVPLQRSFKINFTATSTYNPNVPFNTRTYSSACRKVLLEAVNPSPSGYGGRRRTFRPPAKIRGKGKDAYTQYSARNERRAADGGGFLNSRVSLLRFGSKLR